VATNVGVRLGSGEGSTTRVGSGVGTVVGVGMGVGVGCLAGAHAVASTTAVQARTVKAERIRSEWLMEALASWAPLR
jgi:hypothetical protein